MSYGFQTNRGGGGTTRPGSSGAGSAGIAGGSNMALGKGTLNPAIEQIVRPFESEAILALRARRKAREEDTSDDSLTRWGRPSQYGSASQTKEEDRRGFRVSNLNPKKDPLNPNKPVRVYTEVERTTETVRVRNPSDSTQYVDVARIKSIMFRGPDGVDVRFDLKPPPGEVIS